MKKGLILWVEDDPDDQELIRLTLEALDLAARVRFLPDGQKALDYLSSCLPEDLPAAIILDFKLPMMDAPEIVALLRSNPQWSALPVVVFTSCGSARASEHPGLEIIGKPVEAARFREAVETLARRWA